MQIYNAEIYTGRLHQLALPQWARRSSSCLQGQFEAHFPGGSGVLVKAKAGDCYSEPIAKFHRGHNPHPELS